MPMPRSKKYQESVSMYQRGMSIQELAEFYGITRQATWKILKRRGCKFRDNKRFKSENHFYRGTTASDKSQNMLEYAIRKGIVSRKEYCERCGFGGSMKDGRTAIQAHHKDYNKPLEAEWLCQKCHHKWHKKNKSIPLEG